MNVNRRTPKIEFWARYSAELLLKPSVAVYLVNQAGFDATADR